MPSEQFANNPVTTLVSGITDSQTAIQVTSNDGFPSVTTASGDWFYGTIDNEIVKVTNNPTTLWTAERGNQGTTPVAHNANAVVYGTLTKQSVEDIVANSAGASVAPSTYNSLPAAGTPGNIFVLSDSYYDLAYDNGTSYEFYSNGKRMYPPPAAVNWTMVTAGNAALSNSNGAVYMSSSSTTTTQIEAAMRTIPSTPYTITAKLSMMNFIDQGTETSGFGLIFANGNTTSADIQAFRLYSTASSSQWLVIDSLTATDFAYTGAATLINYTNMVMHGSDVWLRIADSGAQRSVAISRDGVNFITIFSNATGTFITPTHYGFFAQNQPNGRPFGLALISLNVT